MTEWDERCIVILAELRRFSAGSRASVSLARQAER